MWGIIQHLDGAQRVDRRPRHEWVPVKNKKETGHYTFIYRHVVEDAGAVATGGALLLNTNQEGDSMTQHS